MFLSASVFLFKGFEEVHLLVALRPDGQDEGVHAFFLVSLKLFFLVREGGNFSLCKVESFVFFNSLAFDLFFEEGNEARYIRVLTEGDAFQ